MNSELELQQYIIDELKDDVKTKNNEIVQCEIAHAINHLIWMGANVTKMLSITVGSFSIIWRTSNYSISHS